MTLMETIANLIAEGYKIKRNKKGNIDFPVSQKIYEKFVSDVEFPTRIDNYSARNGISTIDELIDIFNSNVKLKGVGKDTIKDAKVNILETIWNSLDETGRAEYLQKIFV